MTNELPEDIKPGSFSGGEEIEDECSRKLNRVFNYTSR